jgi:hypothetical protein
VVGEDAAEQRSGDAGEDEDQLDVALVAPALARRDDLADDRHRQRHQPAGAEALEGAEADQLAERAGHAGQSRAGQEDDDRRDEQRLASVEIAGAPPQRHRDGGAQQVGGDDPGELVEATEVADDRGQRRGHDRLVQRRQEHRQQQAAERQHELAAGVVG